MTTKSKAPAILTGCGCASLLLSILLFAGAYWIGWRGETATTPDIPVTADLAHYANTLEGRTGALAENYVDFEFDYPQTWTLKTDAEGSNFVTVERSVDGNLWESLNVGYFRTAGSSEGNEALYSQLIATLQSQLAQQFPGLRKVREGKTKTGSYDAYEGLFHSTATVNGQPFEIYTRVVLLPTPDAAKGVSLLMMGTSFHEALKEPDDLGRKGELPAVLESFRFTG